jgi:hypothetical protein
MSAFPFRKSSMLIRSSAKKASTSSGKGFAQCYCWGGGSDAGVESSGESYCHWDPRCSIVVEHEIGDWP